MHRRSILYFNIGMLFIETICRRSWRFLKWPRKDLVGAMKTLCHGTVLCIQNLNSRESRKLQTRRSKYKKKPQIFKHNSTPDTNQTTHEHLQTNHSSLRHGSSLGGDGTHGHPRATRLSLYRPHRLLTRRTPSRWSRSQRRRRFGRRGADTPNTARPSGGRPRVRRPR